MSSSAKSHKYLIETVINGYKYTKLWDSSQPVDVGFPRIWSLREVEGGVEVSKFFEVPGAKPTDPESLEGVSVAPADVVEQGCRVTFQHKPQPGRPGEVVPFPVSLLRIWPARNITPVFVKRLPGEHTKFFMLQAVTDEAKEEVFVFTCAGNWVITSEPLEVSFFRPSYRGYLHGIPVFKLKKDTQNCQIKSLYNTIRVKVEDRSWNVAPHETLDLPLESLSKLEIHHAPITWKFAKVRPRKLEKTALQQPEDSENLYFKNLRDFAVLFFLLLLATVKTLPPQKKEAPVPEQLTRLKFEKPTLIVKMPEPPRPEPTPKPTPKATPKPKPTPTAQPKPPPKPPEPPKPKPTAAKVPPPAPVPPKPQPKPAQPPPPPPKVDVSKALSFLGARNKVKVTEVNPNQYQSQSKALKYDAKTSAAQPTDQTLSKGIQPGAGLLPIDTRGVQSIKTEAVGKGKVAAGSKTLNQVEAKVSLSQVYQEGAPVLSTQPGLTVSGGSISQEEIQKVLSESMNKFQYCYEKALLANPSLSGTVTLKWTITESGVATNALVTKSQLNSKPLHDCIAATVKKLHFPRPKGGPAQVEFPFHFSVTRF